MLIYKTAKQVFVFIIGVTVLLIGFALIVLPGPAFIVIPLGLAILASEFAWARFWLRRYKQAASSVISTLKSNVSGKADSNDHLQSANPKP